MSSELRLVVIDRDSAMRRALKARSNRSDVREDALGIGVEAIFARYRGFDGRLWPDIKQLPVALSGGLASVGDLPAIRHYVAGLKDRSACDLIAIVMEGRLVERSANWNFLGFDVGYFQSESSKFSVILNEVIFGSLARLRMLSNRLNRHLLCETDQDAILVQREHDELAAGGESGRGVEKGVMSRIAIFAPEGDA